MDSHFYDCEMHTVEWLDTDTKDFKFGGGGFLKKGLMENIKFIGCTMIDVKFKNCSFTNVIFKNLQLKDRVVSGLQLRDCTIDGNAAFTLAEAT